ncbi:hypothetical protein GIB67_019307 [Kingdonia uniflora]|uniref:Cytochrome P450 n=1 Tax=Kingdonia uniflora TaxID=39325 RepID=A0A7J7L1K7_9MAGN|nr:hypothetical protein GIB67_019307 [Kingdonia uniflora]
MLWKGISKKNQIKEAPQRPGAWPIIGHLRMFAGLDRPFYRLLADMSDKHGPIFKLRFGMRPTVIVSSWEVAKECFTTNDMALATRPVSAASKYLGYNHAIFALSPYGPIWREIRKIATLELLSNHRLELLKHFRIQEVDWSTKELYKHWVTNKASQQPLTVEMKQWFSDLTYNMVFMMVTGKRYFGTGNASDEAEARRFQKALVHSVVLSEHSAVGDSFPFLDYVDIGGFKKDMKKMAIDLDSVSSSWVKEHRQKRIGRGASGQGDNDFIDVMITNLEGTDFSDYDPDTIIKSTILVSTPTQ